MDLETLHRDVGVGGRLRALLGAGPRILSIAMSGPRMQPTPDGHRVRGDCARVPLQHGHSPQNAPKPCSGVISSALHSLGSTDLEMKVTWRAKFAVEANWMQGPRCRPYSFREGIASTAQTTCICIEHPRQRTCVLHRILDVRAQAKGSEVAGLWPRTPTVQVHDIISWIVKAGRSCGGFIRQVSQAGAPKCEALKGVRA